MFRRLVIAIIALFVFIFLLCHVMYLPGTQKMYGLAAVSAFIYEVLLFIYFAFCVLSVLGVIAALLFRNKKYTRLLSLALIVLIMTPFAVYGLSRLLGERLLAASKERAIRNAQPIINIVEQYKSAHGVYPQKLELGKYTTGSMGIKQYYYEPYASTYNVWFKYPEVLMVQHRVFYDPMVRKYEANSIHPTKYPLWFEQIED